MANRRASFTQSDVTKVLKAYRDAGFGAPKIIIEPQKITAQPVGTAEDEEPNPWDRR